MQATAQLVTVMLQGAGFSNALILLVAAPITAALFHVGEGVLHAAMRSTKVEGLSAWWKANSDKVNPLLVTGLGYAVGHNYLGLLALAVGPAAAGLRSMVIPMLTKKTVDGMNKAAAAALIGLLGIGLLAGPSRAQDAPPQPKPSLAAGLFNMRPAFAVGIGAHQVHELNAQATIGFARARVGAVFSDHFKLEVAATQDFRQGKVPPSMEAAGYLTF